MADRICFNCGSLNNNERTNCVDCREKLLSGQEYEDKIRELKKYDEYRKKYNLPGVIIALIILLLLLIFLFLWPAASSLLLLLFPGQNTGIPMATIFTYVILYIILLILFIGVLPKLIGSWKFRRRYRWTREKIRRFKSEIRYLPYNFLITALPNSGDTGNTGDAGAYARKHRGLPTILIVILFILIVLVYMNKYTDFKPLDSIFGDSFLNFGTAQTVSGRYEHHYDYADIENGVAQSDQTWAYVFYSDGSYTTYLDGHEQYSGTWSQTGNKLSVTIPAIAGISDERTFKATVSSDGNSFNAGGEIYKRQTD
ncbi:MAG: hypothetical protein M1479_09615 [Actinobacteria bacterium]|nr:hypothetical protein [Cyanobacteriota bacterium]MCL5772510.1 hypothetical protein [Actinomycetota bacterium]